MMLFGKISLLFLCFQRKIKGSYIKKWIYNFLKFSYSAETFTFVIGSSLVCFKLFALSTRKQFKSDHLASYSFQSKRMVLVQNKRNILNTLDESKFSISLYQSDNYFSFWDSRLFTFESPFLSQLKLFKWDGNLAAHFICVLRVTTFYF